MIVCLVACQKEKTYQVKGRLLQSRSIPLAVTNTSLTLYQPGSGGAPIALGTFSSIAAGKTDGTGSFSIQFKEGKGTFFGIPAANKNALTLTGSDALGLTSFYIRNYPYNTTEAFEPIYLYKKADTLIVKSKVIAPIVATDSFTIYVTTVNGNQKRIKKGYTAPADSELVLDTIFQVVFPHYDYGARRYINDISIYKNRDLLPLPNGLPKQDSLRVEDEKTLTLLYIAY